MQTITHAPTLNGMEIRGWLLGLIDPGRAYMRADGMPARTRRVGRKAPPGRYTYGPGTLTESQLSEHLALAHVRRLEARQRWEGRLTEVKECFGEFIESKAAELAASGATVVRTTAGDLDARIVQFQWGNPVLQIDGFKARLGRSEEGDPTVLSHYLAFKFCDLDENAEPLE